MGHDEDEIAQVLFDKGPVTAGFKVSDDFLKYTSGVYSSKDCNKIE